MSTIFENFFSNLPNITNLPNINWGIQKGIHSYHSGRIYTLIPATAALFCAYKALGELSHALIGSDSLSFRKKLILSSFSENELPISSRISRFTRTFFGSSSLLNRIKRIRNGLGWGAFTMTLLYSLHAYAKKEVELHFPGTSPDLDEINRELFPNSHAYDTKSEALNIFDQNQPLFRYTLNAYCHPESGQQATEQNINNLLKLSNFIFDTSKKTPGTSFLQKHLGGAFSSIQTLFCEAIPSFNSTSLCDPISHPPLVEKMTSTELDQAYESTKALIIQEAPQDRQGQVAQTIVSFCKSFLSWVPGVDAELRCSGLSEGIHPVDTNRTKQDLSNLQTLYELWRTEGQLERQLGSLERVALHDFTDGSYPNESLITEALTGATGLENIAQNKFSKRNKTFLSDSIPRINDIAEHLFQLNESFTINELKREYRKFSLLHHPDKNNNSKSTDLFKIGTILKELFEGLYSNNRIEAPWEDIELSHEDPDTLPNISTVIQDLFTSFRSWYASDLPSKK